MLDINLIRQNPEKVKSGIAAKNSDPKLVDDFLALDENWRKLTKEIDDLRAEQNKFSDERKIEQATKIKDKIQNLESDLKKLEQNRQNILEQLPNLPLDDVPVGKDESENVVIKEVGEKPKFNFQSKDHLELGKSLDLIDFETATKVSGSNFYYLKNQAVLLELALTNYAFDILTKEGFTPLITPDLARQKFYTGTGYLPQGPEAQTYKIKDSDLGLIATAEITLAGIHSDEILDEKDLPKKYAGFSHCFRLEAGSYGKYSKGLYRIHQFSKIEMYVYCSPEKSEKIHQYLLSLEEKIFQGLGIPYRVVEMCTGDLGAQAAKKYDLEAWMPGRGDWGEITSTSNTTDYQARRLGIRFKRKDGSVEFTYTLNGTAIAISRTIIAILENYQQKDGSVLVPKVLQKYLNFKKIG
ncbi:serine--tRNA ligase [Candidatus Wolfebacteria bacterium CG1_02_39_135]|uniref:Serine--tRNA ligase n=4 Tax=Candidatus Wolfeibacteriota TaxID=1752735 RepID=A0A2M7Q849_9BACT|nr:serine--tRNA ligase [Parcubacteria group bacterium]NCO89619.1 serine--tRNA ligase [Candidatus Wolfebacteria bacterium]OIO65024.1 MAG: serine--tRNA ligase [Candidatus Wolfebacteria bacterium CG1_02_39_135]PIU98694.1 MAG: serine--tRNA ligase [Candidatus Wolfebacteria bacterium CG03_land_8_20_14_0_80_39_317]PIY59144.1 MAG: serine--tRNA ligase [Candidatus Wolfebacteria bacterium CG_4_10_14_0_8_um_filter_39_64]PJB84139.1 MAG: serine--tRNA ligase [Candidatus Wolfebacteria bacterium CG_4_9_14_0_8_